MRMFFNEMQFCSSKKSVLRKILFVSVLGYILFSIVKLFSLCFEFLFSPRSNFFVFVRTIHISPVAALILPNFSLY